MTSALEAANQPRLAFRAPTASNSLSLDDARQFIDYAFAATGADEPTVVVVNLDGRILTAGALHEIVVNLGQKLREGRFGDMKVVLATRDVAIQDAVQAFS